MFKNREQAGISLSDLLKRFADDRPVVFALPRGGIPVATSIAKALRAPIEVLLVKKIGAPNNPELAIGAIIDGASPTEILNEDIIRELGVEEEFIEKSRKLALGEIERRRSLYFSDHLPLSPKGKTAIIVDDGLATGSTMETAISAVKKLGANKTIVAVPVAPSDTLERLAAIADHVVCVETPSPFWSVGQHYEDFPQLSDEEALESFFSCREEHKRHVL